MVEEESPPQATAIATAAPVSSTAVNDNVRRTSTSRQRKMNTKYTKFYQEHMGSYKSKADIIKEYTEEEGVPPEEFEDSDKEEL